MVKAQAARVDTLSFNAFRVVVGALFFFILLPFFGGAQLMAQLSALTMLIVAVSVVLGFCIGDSVYFWSMTKIGASRTMPIAGVYPVFTWLLAVPLLGEQVTTLAIVGTGLVIVALYLLGREHLQEATEANDMLITLPGEDEPHAVLQRTRLLGVGAAVLAAFMWACSTTLLRLALQLQEPVTLYDNLQQSIVLGAFRLVERVAGVGELSRGVTPTLGDAWTVQHRDWQLIFCARGRVRGRGARLFIKLCFAVTRRGLFVAVSA